MFWTRDTPVYQNAPGGNRQTTIAVCKNLFSNLNLSMVYSLLSPTIHFAWKILPGDNSMVIQTDVSQATQGVRQVVE